MSETPPRLWGRAPIKLSRPYPKMNALNHREIAVTGLHSIAAINGFVNDAVRYVRDPADVWQSPCTTMETRKGDCEDIALLKIALLRGIGIIAWLLLVFDKLARMHHAVALTQNVILDLHTPKPLPIEIVPDYRPILALTPRETWLYGKVAA